MAYRDALSAARTRIRELERELTDAKERIVELEQTKQSLAPPQESRPARPRQLIGKIYYVPPWTYFPLFVVLKNGLIGGARLEVPKGSDFLIAQVLRYVVMIPLLYLGFLPLFYLVCIPYFAVLAVLSAPVVALWQTLIGLRVGRRRHLGPSKRPEWADVPSSSVFAIFISTVSTAPACGPIVAIVASGAQ